jgi:large subunit ribosomal protein L25
MAETKTKTELKVDARRVLGKKVRRLRREGWTPANIYGNNVQSMAIQVPADSLKQVLRRLATNEIVYLRLDGEESRPAFVKDIQTNPITDSILHVDFYQISLKDKVRLEVPIHLLGTPGAVSRLGGVLQHVLDRVTVEALPADVPSAFEVDVSGLEEFDQSVHVSDLEVPKGVTLLTDPELMVANVAPPAIERALEEEEAAAAEAAAEEAAGAAEAGEPPAAEEGE